jgi:hypothetical protein
MTALQSIIKEAKIIRKKYPNKEWKECVAQASAIYASKHKGKSPVGKKKAVKKVAKKKVAKKVVKKKVAKKKVSGIKRKPSEKDVLKSINKAAKVQKAHMSIGNVKSIALKDYQHVLSRIKQVENSIDKYTKMIKNKNTEKHLIPQFKLVLKTLKFWLKENKTHAKELKKHI